MNGDDPRDPAIDAAYRAAARDEPPHALDERILAAAHRAVSARPAPAGRTFAQRWRVPVALAATVVLSATVTLMVYESEQSPSPSELRGGESLREDRAAPEPPAATDMLKKESGAAGSAPSRDLREMPRQSESEARKPKRDARAPGAMRDEEASPRQKTQGLSSNEGKRAPAPAAASPPAAPPAARQAAPAQSAPVPAPAAPAAKGFAPTPPQAAPARPAEVPLRREEPFAGPRLAPAPAAPPPPAEADEARTLSRERALSDRPAGRGEREAATGALQQHFLTPEEWLAEIRKLKQAGRTDEANGLLAEFRARYADYPIPEDLR